MNAIDFPTITIGNRTLTVRYSLGAQRLLVRLGLDPLALEAATHPENPDATDNWMKIFAAMVDENFIPGGDPSQYKLGCGPTPDYWASQIQTFELIDICRVCNEAMGKVAEARRARASSPKLEAVA